MLRALVSIVLFKSHFVLVIQPHAPPEPKVQVSVHAHFAITCNCIPEHRLIMNATLYFYHNVFNEIA